MRTLEQARAEHAEKQRHAVAQVLGRLFGVASLPRADAVIAAYKGIDWVGPDECDNVDPEFGRCRAGFYGHNGPHYSIEYKDRRRPDGTHPWDF